MKRCEAPGCKLPHVIVTTWKESGEAARLLLLCFWHFDLVRENSACVDQHWAF